MNTDTFISLDLEIANHDVSSICQIGIVTIKDGEITEKWQTLVNPEMNFSPSNVAIHKITPNRVKGSSYFHHIYHELKAMLEDKIVPTYTSFDLACLRKERERYQLPELKFTYLDASRVVRHTWVQYTRDGFGLANVAFDFGITFNHHEAVEDALVTAKIIHKAIQESGVPLHEWVAKAKEHIDVTKDTTPKPSIKRPGDPKGCFYGETIVFTGNLSIHRIQAANLAAQAGCDVCNSMNKRVTLLVVGDLQANIQAGFKKSEKQKQAEKLIDAGYEIKILSEEDFFEMIKNFTTATV